MVREVKSCGEDLYALSCAVGCGSACVSTRAGGCGGACVSTCANGCEGACVSTCASGCCGACVSTCAEGGGCWSACAEECDGDCAISAVRSSVVAFATKTPFGNARDSVRGLLAAASVADDMVDSPVRTWLRCLAALGERV